MRCPRSMGRLLRGGIFVLAVMLFGLPGLAQSVAFSGHVYEGTIPDFRSRTDREILQELNLHYVGITRARRCCVLCWSTRRHFGRSGLGRAQRSRFLDRNGVSMLRVPCPV